VGWWSRGGARPGSGKRSKASSRVAVAAPRLSEEPYSTAFFSKGGNPLFRRVCIPLAPSPPRMRLGHRAGLWGRRGEEDGSAGTARSTQGPVKVATGAERTGSFPDAPHRPRGRKGTGKVVAVRGVRPGRTWRPCDWTRVLPTSPCWRKPSWSPGDEVTRTPFRWRVLFDPHGTLRMVVYSVQTHRILS
jgi:hypothetical protein